MSQNTSGQNTSSQNGTVQYRRAKAWQIILTATSGMVGMSFYFLMGMASYSANVGFGIATVAVGGILTFTRVFDAVTDPLLAFVYDKVNTRFGKIRILLIGGWLVMVFAVLGMYNWAAGKGHGVALYIVLYVVYVIGYTLFNMTSQTVGPLMTNDPKQRPIVGVVGTVFNYLVPITMNLIAFTQLMPKYGGYTLEFLAAACWLTMAATPEGAQGHVTFHVADFWPQPANRAAHTAASNTMLRILLFIISLLFRYCQMRSRLFSNICIMGM